jgi:hypothetical protein
MLAYEGLAELGEVAGDLAAEARAELEPESDTGPEPSPPAAPALSRLGFWDQGGLRRPTVNRPFPKLPT